MREQIRGVIGCQHSADQSGSCTEAQEAQNRKKREIKKYTPRTEMNINFFMYMELSFDSYYKSTKNDI